MQYVFLMIAIVAEVIGTAFLRQTEGFTKLVPSVIAVGSYILCFYALSLAIRTLSTGFVYAIWSGVGIVLVATVAWIFQGQKLDTAAMIGMGLIIAGVVVMNVFSNSAAQ